MPGKDERSLLLVEDDEGLRILLRRYLDSLEEFQTLEAAAVEEARKILEGPQPLDIVVSDIRLPDGTGEELLQWAREEGIAVPFILMTAYHSFERAVEAYQLGAVRYLIKPFDLKTFHVAIEETLDLGSVLDSAMGRLQGAGPGWVKIAGPSTENAAERIREFIAALSSMRLSKKEVADLRLAVEEMVQNAVEWGNRSDPERIITISYALFSDRVLVMICDEGEGFNPSSLPDPRHDPLGHLRARLASGKRIGGYGITLTREMVDDVMYSERGNVVLLTKYAKGPIRDRK